MINPGRGREPQNSQTSWSNRASGSSCTADSHGCTSDVCNSSGGCTHPVKAGYCLISGKCYSNTAISPGDPCQHCYYKSSKTSWSNRSSGSSCTADSYGCTADICNSSGGCTHPVKAGYCLIDGKCYSSGQGGCP